MSSEPQSTALIFEQQPHESNKAFAAFQAFCALGDERTRTKINHKPATLNYWSWKFNWPSRVRARAAHLALIERQAAEATASRNGVDWAIRQAAQREDEWGIRTELIEAARMTLAKFRDGSRTASLGDAVRALDIASKLGRLASGLDSAKPEAGANVNVLVAIDLALDRVYGPTSGPVPAGPIIEVQP